MDAPKMIPIGDRVLVKRDKAAEKSKGGIIIPDDAQEPPKRGTVVALGNGRVLENGTRSTFDCAVGDRVFFTSYGGVAVEIDGEEFLTMREDDLLGKANDDA